MGEWTILVYKPYYFNKEMFLWEKKNLWEDISATKLSNIHIFGHLTPSWE